MEKIEEKMKLMKKKATIYELFNEILDQKIYEERLQEWKSPEVGSYLYKQRETLENLKSRLQHDQPVEVKLEFDDPDRMKARFRVAVEKYSEELIKNYEEAVDRLNKREEEAVKPGYACPAFPCGSNIGCNKKGMR